MKSFYPLDSIDLKGNLNIDIVAKGKYVAEKNIFPVTKTTFNLQDGIVKTNYYPHPVENIHVLATVINKNGTMKDMHVDIEPISFQFEGQPFTIKADLKNFEDLKYDIASNGTLDIGKIYSVFYQKGFDLKGFIKTDLLLKGLQSDAAAGPSYLSEPAAYLAVAASIPQTSGIDSD